MRTNHYRTKQGATVNHSYKHKKDSLCSLCGSTLFSKYTTSRYLINLSNKSKVSIQICSCKNTFCANHTSCLKPVVYQNQIVPESSYGVDVYALIGHLRMFHRKTIPEIHYKMLSDYPHLEFGERHVENMVNHLNLCIEQSGKNADYLSSYFSDRSQSELILSIDGVQPEQGHQVLYIIREIQSGKILWSSYSKYSDAETLAQTILLPLQSVLEKAKLKVSGWLADKELAVSKSITSVYPEVSIQHCQTHFLAAMKGPLTIDDTAIGKELKKNLVR